MKTSRAKIAVFLIISAFLIGDTAEAQSGYNSSYDFKPRSAKIAKRYSLWGTLLPVAAGMAWAKIDGPGKKTYYPDTRTCVGRDDSGEKVATIFMLSGIIVGPSLGYYYGGCPERGTTGLLIRIGTGAAAGLLASSIADSYKSSGWGDLGGVALSLAVIGIGSGIIIYDAAIDISHVKNHVEQNNLKKIRRAGQEISLSPLYFADSGACGMRLNVSF